MTTLGRDLVASAQQGTLYKLQNPSNLTSVTISSTPVFFSSMIMLTMSATNHSIVTQPIKKSADLDSWLNKLVHVLNLSLLFTHVHVLHMY